MTIRFEPLRLDEDAVTTIERPRPEPPPNYRVIFYNDDVTPVDFVVTVLVKIFRKTQEDAARLTIRIHHEGQGVAGIYSREIAETKTAQTRASAADNGFPLRVEYEPE